MTSDDARKRWRGLEPEVIMAVHARQLAEHGGPDGIRDRNGIKSALARPRNLVAYAEPDAAELAAAYLFGLARNHGFVDGNKRTAWIAARLFLADNGVKLAFDKAEAIRLVEGVASGTIDEPELVDWLRRRQVTG